MKKKFLALALAAAVMAPTTSAFAQTNNSQTVGNVNGSSANEYNADVQILGEVRKGDDSAAAGKIEVELPVSTAFVVDGNGNFSSSAFNVSNRGGSSVDLVFTRFVDSNQGGISIEKTLDTGNVANFARNKVRLGLKHTINGAADIFEINEETAETEIGTIAPSQAATLQVLGIAGTKKDGDGEAVENEGARDNFVMIFKIKKTRS